MSERDGAVRPTAAVLTAERGDGARTEEFLALSELLTGFGRVWLAGTGQTDSYLSVLDAVLPPGVLDELLTAARGLPRGADREAAVGPAILADPKLGPVARNVILLWYRGSWTALPAEWRAAYGTSPLDTDHVVSAPAYQAGLQWIAAGAHPAGALQQGYGAWAAAPEGAGR
ncbi:MAG TPA: hypothetical protein VMU51_02705 [Mycobacteriales bacterium]|nr:hypothetical protein [Mycobacteriales bacterium]